MSICLKMLKSLILGVHINLGFSFLNCSFIAFTQGSSGKNIFEGCDGQSLPWHYVRLVLNSFYFPVPSQGFITFQ